MAFPTGWGRKQKITIDNTKVSGSGSHSNFPVLITLDHLNSEIVDAGSNSALNGGGDVRFSSDAAGTTQLSLEVVAFITNATAGTRRCEMWVKVPSVSTSVDTDIYIWYKKAAETQPAVTDTFGRNAVWAGYVYVGHNLETDSTGNSTPTEIGTPTDITGVFNTANGARDLGGLTDVDGYDITVSDLQDFTVQAWINPNSTSTFMNIVRLSPDGSETNYVDFALDPGSDFAAFSSSVGEVVAGGTATTAWTAYAVSLEETVGGRLLINGTNVNNNASFDDSSTGKVVFSIGQNDSASFNWNGDMAEIRLSGNVIQDSFIGTEYNNQNAPATFATAGTPEDAGGTTFFQSNSGSLTPAGDLQNQVNMSLDGSILAAGVLIVLAQKILSGSSTATATLSPQFTALRDLGGTSTPSGTLSKLVNKQLAGSSGPSGAIQKQIAKMLEGSMIPSGGLSKRVEKVLDGSLTPTGTVFTAVVILLQLTGQIIATGALATLFIAGAKITNVFKNIFRPIFTDKFRDIDE